MSNYQMDMLTVTAVVVSATALLLALVAAVQLAVGRARARTHDVEPATFGSVAVEDTIAVVTAAIAVALVAVAHAHLPSVLVAALLVIACLIAIWAVVEGWTAQTAATDITGDLREYWNHPPAAYVSHHQRRPQTHR